MADKPGSVENNHSSGTNVAVCLKQPTQERYGPYLCASTLLFYLVLLQVGFTMPQLLPVARCALTAPFHPYQIIRKSSGGLLSVALAVGSRLPEVIWHLAHWSPDFPHCSICHSAIVWPSQAGDDT
jgi:hypothetical protein